MPVTIFLPCPPFLQNGWRFLNSLKRFRLGHFFGQPISHMEEFLDLSPFITILERFFGLMFCFAKRMFWIPNRFADDFECFHHSYPFQLCDKA